jgi:hypothetical protein
MNSTVEAALLSAGSHRVPIECNDLQGTIQLLQSTCVLNASLELRTIRLNMEAGGNEKQLRTVVEEHLQRCRVFEELVFKWNHAQV